jgi:hypothetical protein
MKKIKRFKINIRLREVLRHLKTTGGVSEITLQIEDTITRESARLQKIITTAAVYDTNPQEKLPMDLIANPPKKWVAASMFALTIGTEIEQEIQTAHARGEAILGQILHCIALEAVEQSCNFVIRLITEEAKDEECELLPRQMFTEAAQWPRILEVLPGNKIGLGLSGDNVLQPVYSAGGLIFWLPVKKRK